MTAVTYDSRRAELTTYFDRTAADAWEALTSDAPVSRIRATVRAGREQMRALLLSRLPADIMHTTLLDAGCGTGSLSVEAAWRGATVLGIDVSPRMIAIARERQPSPIRGRIDFRAGDMLDLSYARFGYVVAMDSLIHYREPDILAALSKFATFTDTAILFTIAPRTPLLGAMHSIGKLFPRGDRAPAIEPIALARLTRAIDRDPRLADWRVAWSQRVTSGFYMSQALELVRR